ncbi:hypothetical protein EDD17DRAFT_1516400 [Pisolithus thermaeus]|nr:hypothetical protein EDD17DRAFT_1516400 [Pisolithus thermaeus]
MCSGATGQASSGGRSSAVSYMQELYGPSVHVGWKDIPAHLKEKPMMAAKLKELHEKKYIYIPWYTCPEVTCQTFVECKPMEVDAARHMIGTVNAIFGAPAGQVDSTPLLQHGNIWADVFYEDDSHTSRIAVVHLANARNIHLHLHEIIADVRITFNSALECCHLVIHRWLSNLLEPLGAFWYLFYLAGLLHATPMEQCESRIAQSALDQTPAAEEPSDRCDAHGEHRRSPLTEAGEQHQQGTSPGVGSQAVEERTPVRTKRLARMRWTNGYHLPKSLKVHENAAIVV